MSGYELEIVLAIIGIFFTVVWVYSDATKNKIGKIEENNGLFNMSAALWSFGTLVLWIVIFPAYIMKRKSLIQLAIDNPVEVKNQNIKVIIITLVLVLISIFLVLRIGLNNTVEIVVVKQGIIKICPNHSVKEMIDNTMTSPTWTSGRAGGSIYFVNVVGDINFENKKSKALIQFKIDKKAGTCDYQALEINGVAQKLTTANTLLKNMCDNVK